VRRDGEHAGVPLADRLPLRGEPARADGAERRATIAVAHVGDEPTNLRDGPGTRYRVIGVARPGTRVEVLGSEAGWLEIRDGAGSAWLAEDGDVLPDF
jgi:Bacterial SH3 domain